MNMKVTRTVRRVLAAALSCTMLLNAAASMPDVTAAGACTVNTNKTYQLIRGFGGMNLPEWQGYDLTDAQIQTCFGNGAGQLDLSVLRVYVSDDSSAWSRAVPTAKGAQNLGATVFATPWNPPAAIRQDDGKPTKRGYLMAQYSKWVRPGDVRIDAAESPDSNLLISAYKHSDKQITIVAINKGSGTILNEYNQTKNKLNSILGVNRDYLVHPPFLAVNDTVKKTPPGRTPKGALPGGAAYPNDSDDTR